jgi:hypothetical protein
MSLGMGGLVLGLLFFLAIVVAQQFWVVLAVWVLAAAGLCIPRPTRGLGIGMFIGTVVTLANLQDLTRCLVIC